MVFKLRIVLKSVSLSFESDVISDGIQAFGLKINKLMQFESDVISDGIQARRDTEEVITAFESDVISDGTQAQILQNLQQYLFESDVISDATQAMLIPPGISIRMSKIIDAAEELLCYNVFIKQFTCKGECSTWKKLYYTL